MSQVSFADIKAQASPEQLIAFLGLDLEKKLVTKNDGTQEYQFRGRCPLCKCNQREFVIGSNKKLFHCFKCKEGGDFIKLVSKTKSLGTREAAEELDKACGEKKSPAPTAEVLSFDVEKYAQKLDPAHESLKPLGISPDTLRDWKAGYVSNFGGKGARLALPINSLSDGVIGYMGMKIDPDNPELDFPKNIDHKLYIFGTGLVEGEDLYLTRSPLDVLQAWDNGINNVIAFLNDPILSGQLQYLIHLLDKGGFRSLSLM